MTAISNRQPEVYVHYDTAAGRTSKHFTDAYAARRFYTAKDKLGKNPRVSKDPHFEEHNTMVKRNRKGDPGDNLSRTETEKGDPGNKPARRTTATKIRSNSANKTTPRKPYAVLRAHHTSEGPLYLKEVKELLGWEEEPADGDWGDDYHLKDLYNRKVRLTKNPTNRPLKLAIAKRYASEFLRKVWYLNLETIVFGQEGELRDGQHRLVGFVLAEQERSISTHQWGEEPLFLEALLGFNVSNDKEVADSYDKGQSRSLDDVIYRHEDFSSKLSDKQQRKISRTLAVALRLVWLRSGGKVVSDAPHFPHSEAMEFYENHKGILNSVKKIIKMDEEDRGISSLISLGYAAGLHYLMGKVDSEKAGKFWQTLADAEGLTKGKPIHSLRGYLTSATAGSGLERDAIVGAVVKAWLAYVDNKPLSRKEVPLKRKKQGDKMVFAESPRIGGLDVAKEAKPQLSIRQRLILSTLTRLREEVTYATLSEETGLSKNILGREIFSETKNDDLVDQGLVTVKQYEPQNGETTAPYYAKITTAGAKQV